MGRNGAYPKCQATCEEGCLRRVGAQSFISWPLIHVVALEQARAPHQVWGRIMDDRLYTFRYFRDDNIVSTNHVRAEDDAQARDLAQEAMFGFDVEVWDDGRFVYASEGRPPKPGMPAPK